MTSEVASSWLENNSEQPGNLFRSFLVRHGHRSIKEFDFSTETWGLNPRSLVSVLQSMVSNPSSFASNSQPTKSNEDWLKSIAQNKPGKYRALKFFVPRSRDAVCAREKTKSLLIRTIHVFRMAYRQLARLLYREGKIPDQDLIFFFTHSELQELIDSNGTALINKANRRRRLHPELDALVFPEMSLGIPKPAQDTPTDDLVKVYGRQNCWLANNFSCRCLGCWSGRSSIDRDSSVQRNCPSYCTCRFESRRSKRDSEWGHLDHSKHRYRMESLLSLTIWRGYGTRWLDFARSCCCSRICNLTYFYYFPLILFECFLFIY